MNLPFNFFKKKPLVSYFLIFFIKNSSVSVVVFETINSKAKIVGKNIINLETKFSEENPEILLEKIDNLLAEAEKNLPDNIQTEKTILTLSQDFVENGKIRKDILITLRKICKNLSLVPLGFLVYTECLINFLHAKEGAPLSAILIEKDQKTNISLVRADRVVETREILPLEFMPLAVDETLKHFINIEFFPSKIVVISEKNTEQDFLKHTWSNELPFIHPPQIFFLEEAVIEKSIISTVLKQLNLTFDDKILTNNDNETSDLEINNLQTKNINHDENETKDFGFIKDKDIKEIEKNQSNIYLKNNFLPEEKDKKIEGSVALEENLEIKKDKNNLAIEGGLIASKFKEKIKNIVSVLKKNKLPLIKKPKGKRKHFLISIIIIIVIGLAIFLFLFLSFANVTIYFSPNYIDASSQANFTTTNASDFGNNQISAQPISVTENGSVNEKATGTKAIGKSAQGQVTIFSRLTNTTTLPAGTNFISDNGLNFTLNSNTQIASFSGDPSNPSVTISNIALTASDIGENYNLPSGTKFTIQGLSNSNISAKNDNPFAGGTKKNITIIQKSDMEKADQDLINNLLSKAKSDILQKNQGNFILPNFINEKITSQTSSQKIGDQTNNFNLNASVTFTNLTAFKSDLLSYAKNLLKQKISDNLLENNLITYDITNIKNNNGNINFIFNTKAKLIPSFNKKTLAKSLTGKKIIQGEKIINDINQVNGVTIDLFPNFPFIPKIIPLFPNHINFKFEEK